MGSANSRTALRTLIHALINGQSLPHIFLTLNPVDIHSPVALYFAGVKLDLDNIQIEQLINTYKRAEIIAFHPVATAKFFHLLITNILNTMIIDGVLGPIKAYFGTAESQGRGSLHLHLLIWLGHDMKLADMEERIQDANFRDKLKAYLEDIIKEDLDDFKDKHAFEDSNGTDVLYNQSDLIPACLPTQNPSSPNFASRFRADAVQLVETSDVHKHSDTCYKKKINAADMKYLSKTGVPVEEAGNQKGRSADARYPFQTQYPQTTTHPLMKYGEYHVPILYGPQIPRRDLKIENKYVKFVVAHRQSSSNESIDYANQQLVSFIFATPNLIRLNTQWQEQLRNEKEWVRRGLITGHYDKADDTLDLHAVKDAVVTVVNPSNDNKNSFENYGSTIPVVSITTNFSTQKIIADEFTLNKEQQAAFIIITSHLDGDSRHRTDTFTK
ncbi:unnamed protein product [Rotaria sp. Silwood1]|nr:unnamed protein product [Rotaria sp. Silwood1]CAF3533545.1 unnamed protein product [Rotaria sp. Silwood1]CAF3607045.1 unnamed protein product [Rotaria sp. Silwood1]